MTNQVIKYIEQRIKTIQRDERDMQKDVGEGMIFSAEDVIQELKWVLEKAKKRMEKVIFT